MWYLMQNRSTIEREGFAFEDHDDLSEARTLRFVPFLGAPVSIVTFPSSPMQVQFPASSRITTRAGANASRSSRIHTLSSCRRLP